jgi:arylformamidase
MKIYDVSVAIHPKMQAYPGDPRFRAKSLKSLEKGDPYSLSKIMMSNHTGTHVDAPSHMIPAGLSVTELPLDVMNGRSRVVHIHHREKIDVPELKQLILMDDFRILFKTRNSLLWSNHKYFSKKYIYLTEDGARFLIDNGIKLIGFDYHSVERYGENNYPVHKILLENQIVLIEGLNLAEVDDGEYELSCLPLPLKGMDAAPARVILKQKSGKQE